MTKVDALAQLKDIHLPHPVGWWPLASGWYVLIGIIFIGLIFIVYFSYQRYLGTQAKKQALALLQVYAVEYTKTGDTQLTSARISELLKRVALVYYPRQHVAGLHGEEWINFLNSTGQGVDFKSIKTMLLDLPFKPNDFINLNPLIMQAKRWIKQRKRPCSN